VASGARQNLGMDRPEDYFDDESDALDDEVDEYEAFDCHMGPGGQCGAAGSEECDFACPYMRDIRWAEHRRRAAAGAKLDRKRGQKRLPLEPS
jgi:hypothetical protein